jgi:hypothetical protein
MAIAGFWFCGCAPGQSSCPVSEEAADDSPSPTGRGQGEGSVGHCAMAKRVLTVFQFRVVAPTRSFFSMAVLESLDIPYPLGQ